CDPVMNRCRHSSSTCPSWTTTQPAPGGVRISRCWRCLPPGSSTSAIRMSSHSSVYKGFSEWTVQRMAASIPGCLALPHGDAGQVGDPFGELGGGAAVGRAGHGVPDPDDAVVDAAGLHACRPVE